MTGDFPYMVILYRECFCKIEEFPGPMLMDDCVFVIHVESTYLYLKITHIWLGIGGFLNRQCILNLGCENRILHLSFCQSEVLSLWQPVAEKVNGLPILLALRYKWDWIYLYIQILAEKIESLWKSWKWH